MQKVNGSWVCSDGHSMNYVGVIPYEDGTFTVFFQCSNYLCGEQHEIDIPIEVYDLLKSKETQPDD